MSAKHQFVKIKLSKKYSQEERLAIGQELIDYIRDRTAKGKGKGEKTFSGSYSSSYVNSPEFKAARKSKGTINLRLTGDMLTSIQILDEKPGEVVIGFEKGSQENAKADGNIRGTYGSSRANSSKARDFLGVTRQEVMNYVLEKFPVNNREQSLLQTRKVLGAGEEAQAFIEDAELDVEL